MAEVKPCPFCGSEVEAMKVSYGIAGVITCKNCKTKFVLPWNEAETKKDLIEAWNKRAVDKKSSKKKEFDDTCPVCGIGKAEGEISTIPCFEDKFGSKDVYRLVCNNCGRKTIPCDTIEESELRWMKGGE